MNRRSPPVPVRASFRAVPTLVALAAISGCPSEPRSGLEARSETKQSSGNPAPEEPVAAQDPPPDGPRGAAEDGDPPKLDPEPPEGAELHELRLSLGEGTEYRVLTVGFLKLPAVMSSIGFAREEGITLSGCEGEGFERTCTLTHEYLKFEAEMPSGGAIANDEKRVADLGTSHQIKATGGRLGETTVSGPEEAMATPDAQGLSQAHRFFCLKLPDQPIAEGATWRDTCKLRIGGRIAERQVIWTLEKVEEAPEGKRAQLKAAGKLIMTDPETGESREGTVQDLLFFFVDAGEPHVLKEKTIMPIGGGGLSSTTTLNIQFAKADPKAESGKVLTDGRPYVEPERTAPPAQGNDPERTPEGAPASPPEDTTGPG